MHSYGGGARLVRCRCAKSLKREMFNNLQMVVRLIVQISIIIRDYTHFTLAMPTVSLADTHADPSCKSF